MDTCKLSDLLGKKFEIGGRGPETFDCFGLCQEVARRAGLQLPELYTPDSLEMRDKTFTVHAEKYKKLERPAPWCVVAFIIRAPFVTHMGIVLPDCMRFIHITNQTQESVIERLGSIVWKKRIAGYYELTAG